MLRSFLYAPATSGRKLERLGDAGADAVVIDLEDAVAEAEKDRARETVPAALARIQGPLRCVRINALRTGRAPDDLRASVGPALDAVVVPKTESADELGSVDAELSRREAAHGLQVGAVRIVPLIETARGILLLDRIVEDLPARVLVLHFGLGDFSSEIGVQITPGGQELAYARSRMVVASRAAGLPPPVDGPFTDLRDDDGLFADSQRSAGLGLGGRVVIHPGQLATVHRAYSLVSESQLRRARATIEAFESAEAQGLASILVDGRFVDYPFYRQAVEVVRRHDHYLRALGA